MLPNEKTLLSVKRSCLALTRGALDLVVTLVFIYLSARALANPPFWDSWWLVEEYRKLATRFLWEGAGIPASWIAIALGLVALLFALDAMHRLVREFSTRYEVTNLRLTLNHGLLGKHREDLYLLSVDGVTLERSLAGRLLGWGSLTLRGRGNNSLEWRFVRDPEAVRDQIDKLVLARRMQTSVTKKAAS
ncbi:PH domain-containing protein [Marinobacterium stanieri]|uniref:PH domain-containing protein n=1 Tax=Marinobacterium stanieri TaxID=49186 RepID=UPI003A93B3BB